MAVYFVVVARFPLKKPIRHGSILNRESPTDKKQKVERIASHDFDPTDSSSKKTKSSSEESRSEIYGNEIQQENFELDPVKKYSYGNKNNGNEEICTYTVCLVQRCVIIQKDDNGFGLTVSGDNPVFVQSVKEGKHF
ncbi:Rho guanine nucleotide exchange factor 12 [Saguinus oedipus]|uniref:Rho guanine nucleotide exchange factor 12 n=1 Tax=Saguinus oedipus TaxID=9490 RepID=A0ABQ9URD8_SAGOE|nr:Rho guanine nucleotide exchange factor 12 [Saguinus oedipus]